MQWGKDDCIAASVNVKTHRILLDMIILYLLCVTTCRNHSIHLNPGVWNQYKGEGQFMLYFPLGWVAGRFFTRYELRSALTKAWELLLKG